MSHFSKALRKVEHISKYYSEVEHNIVFKYYRKVEHRDGKVGFKNIRPNSLKIKE